ncbi:MAG: YybH family protein [Lewinella sp.]|uniref:YybH family protein n=1 Tax=Lewinella sp. TaxID=2004506 RepID=UPI003D6C5A5B
MLKQMLWVAATMILSFTSCETAPADNNSSTQNQITMNSSQEKAAINELLFAYRDALNASDIGAILALYADDGIFMPTGAPTSIGQKQVKSAYEFVFSNIQLTIEFQIDEIELTGDYAFARTTSQGSTLIHATGANVAEENRELFVLQKIQGQWKIARYMFNKMQ